MKSHRKGMASVESLLVIAVGAMILLGLTNYWQAEVIPQTERIVAVVLGQEENLDTSNNGSSVRKRPTGAPKNSVPLSPKGQNGSEVDKIKENREEVEGGKNDKKSSTFSVTGDLHSDDGFGAEAEASKEIYGDKTANTETSISAQGKAKISQEGYEVTGGIEAKVKGRLGGGFQLEADAGASAGVKDGEATVKAGGRFGIKSPKGDGVFINSEVESGAAKVGVRIQGATESNLDGIPNDGDNVGGEVGLTTKKLPYFDIKWGRELEQDGKTKFVYGFEIGVGGRYIELGYEDVVQKKLLPAK